MDQGLFTKHLRNLQDRINKKQDIINVLLEKTGVLIEEAEIIVQGKKVTLSTSSVKKAALIQKGAKEELLIIGYTLQN